MDARAPLESGRELTPEAESQLRAKVADLVSQAHAAQGDGNADAATALLQKAVVLAQLMDDPALVAELLVECSHVLAGIGEYRLALRFLERAREIAVEGDLEEVKGEVYRGYGGLYKARGQWNHASVAYDRALDKLEFSTRHGSICRALLDLSEIYLRDGRASQALHLLKRAENLPPASDPPLEVRLRLNLGRLAYLAGDLARALDAYEAAAKVARAANRNFERELICIGLAGLYLEDGQLGPCVQALREALALSIVASAREPLERVERARLVAMGQRLTQVDIARSRGEPPLPLAAQLEEAVRLYNAHPFVLTGKLPPYGSVNASLEMSAPEAPAAEDWVPTPGSNANPPHPNPK